MNQIKFENYGRAIIIANGTFIAVLMMVFVTTNIYEGFQENELLELKKKESKLQTKLYQQQIKNLKKQYSLYEKAETGN